MGLFPVEDAPFSIIFSIHRSIQGSNEAPQRATTRNIGKMRAAMKQPLVQAKIMARKCGRGGAETGRFF